jgi:hypothetical protein
VKKRLMLKSFGFGIMSAEMVPGSAPVKPNGDLSDMESEVLSCVRRSGPDPLEAVVDTEDKNKAYLLMSEGHPPSRHEFSQMEPSDWERLRTAVDLHGSRRFSERLTMLEEERATSGAGQ